MILTVDTTPNEIRDYLKQEVHDFRYNNLKPLPFLVKRHSSGFGKFIHLWQDGRLIAGLKCDPQMESFVVAKTHVEEALVQMGFEIVAQE